MGSKSKASSPRGPEGPPGQGHIQVSFLLPGSDQLSSAGQLQQMHMHKCSIPAAVVFMERIEIGKWWAAAPCLLLSLFLSAPSCEATQGLFLRSCGIILPCLRRTLS